VIVKNWAEARETKKIRLRLRLRKRRKKLTRMIPKLLEYRFIETPCQRIETESPVVKDRQPSPSPQ
jgi:hypothetical protein